MEKIRKKLAREKIVIAMYQYILLQTTEEEIDLYLSSDKDIAGNESERTFCRQSILNIINQYDEFSKRINNHLKSGWSVDRLSKMELAILLVGCHDLFVESIDKKVVINEAVEIAKKYCDEKSYQYINGVLHEL